MPNAFRSIFSSFLLLPRWKKIGITTVIFAFVLLAGVRFQQYLNRQGGYVLGKVTRTAVLEVVSDSGKIVSGGTITVYSPTKGFIEELFVENGQVVKEDDKLFKVKSSATASEQQTAYSAYLSAVSTLKASEDLIHSLRSTMYTDWKTFYDLATSSTYEKSDKTPIESNRNAVAFQSAKEDWLAAERKVINQEAVVAANRAAVASAWTAYQTTQTTTVTAQVAGVVQNLSVSTGNSVGVVSILTPNVSPVLTLVANTTPEAVLSVGQTNIAKVKIGQKAVIHPDSYKDKDYHGAVVRVDSLGENIAGVIVYNVYIQLSDADEILRPGMTVDGDIITNQKENVLTVPNSAVVLYNGGKAVRILSTGNVMKHVPVTVGIKGETRTEILEGVSEGQQIITALTNEKAPRQSFLGL